MITSALAFQSQLQENILDCRKTGRLFCFLASFGNTKALTYYWKRLTFYNSPTSNPDLSGQALKLQIPTYRDRLSNCLLPANIMKMKNNIMSRLKDWV